MKLLDIGALSEKSGLPPSALRYYEEIGLIQSVARHGLRRQFDSQALTQIALVSLGKMAGFSLTEIKSIFRNDGSLELPRAQLLIRANDLDAQIRDLMRLRDALRHVAECPAESHMQCPKFRRLVHFAGQPKSSRSRRQSARA